MEKTTLAQNPEYFDQVIELIEKAFGYKEGFSFKQDFAPLLEKPENLFVLLDKNRVIGHVGVRELVMGHQDIKLNVAFFGGIAIDEAYRGQGHFKDFFQDISESFEQNNHLFFLWSDLHDLYYKLGFYLVGGQCETNPDKLFDHKEALAQGFKKVDFSNLGSQNLAEMQKIYHDLPFLKPERNLSDWQVMQKIESTNLYVKKQKDQLESYFFTGKGMDLGGIVHDWASSDIPKFCDAVKGQKVWLPEKYKDKFESSHLHYLALLKVTNFDRFKNFIHQWSQNKIEITHVDSLQTSFQFNDDAYEYETEEFLKLLFGPCPAAEFQDLGAPLFIFGLDSI